MQKTIIEPTSGDVINFKYDGIDYEFRLTTYENIDGYAKIIVIDLTNDERYISNGYIEINNHVIISRWKQEYNVGRDNYDYNSRELVITIQ